MRVLSIAMCAILLFAGNQASAQDDEKREQDDQPQDVVALSTGNRLRGQIVRLYRGELSFSIDGAGAVDIDWNNVETLTSTRAYDVELASGRRLSGSIVSPSPGRLAVVSVTAAAASGGATATSGVASVIGKQDVVRITPLVSPAEGLSGYIDFGADFLSASDELDLTLNAEIEKRTRNYLTSFSLDSITSEVDDETEHRRQYLQVVSRRFLANRWFAVGRLDLEEDLSFDLDSRALLGAGGGRTLIQSNRSLLALYGGFDFDRERLRDVPGTDRNTEAFASLEWDWFEVGGNMEVSTNATTFFDLDRSRRRVELDVSLHRTIVGNMFWSLNLYDSYDSEAPPEADSNNLGLAFALGRSGARALVLSNAVHFCRAFWGRSFRPFILSHA